MTWRIARRTVFVVLAAAMSFAATACASGPPPAAQMVAEVARLDGVIPVVEGLRVTDFEDSPYCRNLAYARGAYGHLDEDGCERDGTVAFDDVALADHARVAQTIDLTEVATDRIRVATYDVDGHLLTAWFALVDGPSRTPGSTSMTRPVSCPSRTISAARRSNQSPPAGGSSWPPTTDQVVRMSIRTVIQRGPKGKRSVAFSLDWPGWSRGAKTPELALETLESYRTRYRPVASLAGMADEFDSAGPLELVEDGVGTGSTDFWGISFSPSTTEQGPMDDAALERGFTLLQACWTFFDGVAARVSPEMRKGPRGGGRDRDRIVRHTIRTESEDFAKQVGLRIPEEAALTSNGLRRHRETYLETMRAYNAGEGKRMRSWTLPFLIRHSAFHTLDHAWEMEDKDLSDPSPGA